MRSSDFLLQLKKALENELSAAQVQDNVEYYKNYIKEEMKSGKSEQEVMDMLGDPWAIAKTILLEEKMSGPQESINSEEVWSDQEQKQQSQKIHVFGLDSSIFLMYFFWTDNEGISNSICSISTLRRAGNPAATLNFLKLIFLNK